MSGAVCAGEVQKRKWCLAVNDEKLFAQFFAVKNKTLKPTKRIYLLPKKLGTTRNKEIDAEAVAYHDGFVYVAASHGLSRKASKFRPSQFFTFRFPVNKTTGKPTFDIIKKFVPPQIERTSRLKSLIRENPMLAPYAEQPLKQNGVALEGMAVTAKGIHFGFRTPSINGKAVVLTAPTAAFFGSGPVKVTTTALHLGPGQGIRDMAATPYGILILSGPAQNTNGPASVFLWHPATGDLQNYGTLPIAAHEKAETILLLAETHVGKRSQFDVLILFDGQKNGKPRQYHLQ